MTLSYEEAIARKRTTVSAKLTPGKHDDLIALWQSIPQGERQAWLIAAMEYYSGRQQEPDRLEQMIQGLPFALEKVIRNALKTITVVGAPAVIDNAPKQSTEDMAARDAAMSKNKWNKWSK